MENKVPTSEEIFNQIRPIIADKNFSIDEKMNFIYNLAVKHTKLHCQQQLEAILENVETTHDSAFNVIVDTNSIINAYDLNQIK